jgi:hypothetical protein
VEGSNRPALGFDNEADRRKAIRLLKKGRGKR